MLDLILSNKIVAVATLLGFLLGAIALFFSICQKLRFSPKKPSAAGKINYIPSYGYTYSNNTYPNG